MRKIAFGWYGGKFSHLGWLLPLLPPCHHYCEPFGGSASVLLNRKPSPLETYNDLDGEVVNFFRVLRNGPMELVRAISLTPFSREEFVNSIGEVKGSEAEMARRFFVRARQARTGLAQTATPGRWAYHKETSRHGMSGSVSRWLNGTPKLCEVADRLARVQIEHSPAIEVVRRYDSPRTLFYCDPPYVHESRNDYSAYSFEMTDSEHRLLASTLSGISGKAAVSGYDCGLMAQLYRGWNRVQSPTKKCHSSKGERTEVLWTNY